MAAGRGPHTGRPGREDGRGAARAGVRPAAAVAGRAARPVAAGRPAPLRRIAVLAVIAIVLAVLLAPAMRTYLAQRQHIAALAAQVAGQRALVSDLQRQRRAWDDPAYITAQARDRLKFVMPGDRAYTVIDPAPRRPVAPAPGRVAVPVAANRAWFGTLWRSVELAGAR